MKKTWKEITKTLNEAKFKLPRDQKEVKKTAEKVGGRTVEIYASQKINEAKFMYISMV